MNGYKDKTSERHSDKRASDPLTQDQIDEYASSNGCAQVATGERAGWWGARTDVAAGKSRERRAADDARHEGGR